MTTTDAPLFELTVPDYAPELSLAERADLFLDANPHVLDAMEAMAEDWFAAGNQRVGAKALWERLRWEVGIRTTDSAPCLNNSYVAFASRRLLARRPEWADRILTRHQKAA